VLILGRGGHLSHSGQVGQKLRHFRLSHFQWMPLFVKQNKAADPVCVGLFGADAEMFPSNDIPDVFEQFRLVRRNRGGYILGHVPQPAKFID
jgi:hypothetical protein